MRGVQLQLIVEEYPDTPNTWTFSDGYESEDNYDWFDGVEHGEHGLELQAPSPLTALEKMQHHEPMSEAEIGKVLGIDEQEVSRIIRGAMRKLRLNSEVQSLFELVTGKACQ